MNRSALVSVGVFVCLLAAFAATRGDRVRVGLRSLELPRIAAADVTELLITGAARAKLRRADAGWSVEDPATPGTQHDADGVLVERLLAAIADLEIAGFVTGRSENHADLEIDDEQGLRLEIHTRAGTVADVILGRRAKGGGDLIRRTGDEAVFETRTSLASQARRSAEDWRRRELTQAEFAAIGALQITGPGAAELSLVRSEGEPGSSPIWTLAQGPTLPAGFELDQPAAQRVARALARLRADEFVDEDPGEDVTGLGNAATRVEARGPGGEPLVAVRVGAEDEQGRVFLLVEGDSQIYRVSKARADQLAPTLAKLRDLSLLRGDVTSIEGVVFAHGPARSVLSKQAGAWQLTESDAPPGYEFDGTRVPPRLFGLARTKGLRVLDPAELEAADFSDPLSIELSFADGTARTILFGAVLEEGGAGGAEGVVRSADGFVYAIGAVERERYENPLPLFERVAPPPPRPEGGGVRGLENLPPDVRKQIEEQLRLQGLR